MTNLSLELYFEYSEDLASNARVWELLSPIHDLIAQDKFNNQCTGSVIQGSKLGDSIKRTKEAGFSYVEGVSGFSYYSPGQKSLFYNLSGGIGAAVILVQIENIISNSEQAELLVNQFSSCSLFSQALIYEEAYSHIQNIKEPRNMERCGFSAEGLPLIHNGASPPLDGYVIDISNNPGRCIQRIGYVEVVGSTMWLSPLFWKNSGTDKAKALKALGDYVLDDGDIVKIHVQDKPFTEKDGKEAELQHFLLNVLFGDART